MVLVLEPTEIDYFLRAALRPVHRGGGFNRVQTNPPFLSPRYNLYPQLVSCPASLSHAEKESGETCIQFWFPVPRSWCGQSAQIAEQCRGGDTA